MGLIHKTKNLFIDRLYQTFGLRRSYARIVFDIFVEAFTDVLKENNNIYVEGIGRFKYHIDKHNRLYISFKAGDVLKCKLKGMNARDFINNKHRHKKIDNIRE